MIEAHIYEEKPGRFTVHVVRVQDGRRRLLCANQGPDRGKATEDALEAAGVPRSAVTEISHTDGFRAGS